MSQLQRAAGVVGALLILLTATMSSQTIHSKCIEIEHKPASECIIPYPKILHVYWDTSSTQWDSDAGSEFSQARIDHHTQELVRSSYFSQLGQYHVGAAEFAGSVTTDSCASPPRRANLSDMRSVLNCVRANQPARFDGINLVVLLIPPQTPPEWVEGPGFSFGTCANYGGFHLTLDDLPTAIIPVKCQSNFNDLFATLTHEVTEAITDPASILQEGWVDSILSDQARFGTTPLAPEIGDLCPDTLPHFLDGSANGYWSKDSSGCVTGFAAPDQAPAINDVQLCGAGQSMRITLTGRGFGRTPPDLPSFYFSPGVSNSSLYFKLVDDVPASAGTPTSQWQAGHAPDPLDKGVTVKFLSWNDTTIQIVGFGGTYGTNGAIANPGDSLAFMVWNTDNGLSSIDHDPDHPDPITRSIPPVSIIRNLGADHPDQIVVGTHTFVSGLVQDASGCGDEAVTLALTLTGGDGSIDATAKTDGSGRFRAAFQAPLLAGPVTVGASVAGSPPITASAVVVVAPIVNTIVSSHGNVSGGSQVTIAGSGFVDGATTVEFGGVAGTEVRVTSPTQLQVKIPPSQRTPAIGPVPVTVHVRGIQSLNTLTFTYIQPLVPYLEFSDGHCGRATLSAQTFAAEGFSLHVPITFQAKVGSFLVDDAPVTNLTRTPVHAEPVVVTMVTADSHSGDLQASAHSSPLPSVEGTASLQMLSHDACEQMGRFQGNNNFGMRVITGERLIPTVTNGCTACASPSQFRVVWQARTPLLEQVSAVALVNDQSIATDLSVSVLGAADSKRLMQGVSDLGNVGILVEVRSAGQKVPFDLTLPFDEATVRKGSRPGLYQLQKNRWIPVTETKVRPGNTVTGRVVEPGVYAVIVTQ